MYQILKGSLKQQGDVSTLHQGFTRCCYVRIRPDPDVPRERRKGESGGQLLTVHTRTRAGKNEIKTRGDKDGRSRTGGSERSEEPQTETREK